MNYVLIVRECKCGCGKAWRTLKTSQNFYWSETHRHWNLSTLLKTAQSMRAAAQQKKDRLFEQIKEWHRQKMAVFEMTARINAMGYRTPRRRLRYSPKQVYSILWRMKLSSPEVLSNRRRATWRGEEE